MRITELLEPTYSSTFAIELVLFDTPADPPFTHTAPIMEQEVMPVLELLEKVLGIEYWDFYKTLTHAEEELFDLLRWPINGMTWEHGILRGYRAVWFNEVGLKFGISFEPAAEPEPRIREQVLI